MLTCAIVHSTHIMCSVLIIIITPPPHTHTLSLIFLASRYCTAACLSRQQQQQQHPQRATPRSPSHKPATHFWAPTAARRVYCKRIQTSCPTTSSRTSRRRSRESAETRFRTGCGPTSRFRSLGEGVQGCYHLGLQVGWDLGVIGLLLRHTYSVISHYTIY